MPPPPPSSPTSEHPLVWGRMWRKLYSWVQQWWIYTMNAGNLRDKGEISNISTKPCWVCPPRHYLGITITSTLNIHTPKSLELATASHCNRILTFYCTLWEHCGDKHAIREIPDHPKKVSGPSDLPQGQPSLASPHPLKTTAYSYSLCVLHKSIPPRPAGAEMQPGSLTELCTTKQVWLIGSEAPDPQ